MKLQLDYMFNYIESIQKYVSHDSQTLLHKYVKLILEWNKKTNLTSKHSAKSRIHDFICEGIALSQLLGNDRSVVLADVGSGAGFPGIVLSILGFENVHLVEINQKKAAFLQYAVAELGLKTKVYNEDVKKISLMNVDYITSKAVTSTNDLISLCRDITSSNTKFIFCKNSDDSNIGCTATCVSLTDRLNSEKVYRFITLSC